MTIQAQAKQFIDLGIAIIPIRYRDKRPAIKSWEPYKTRLPSDTELATWFTVGLHNYGVVVGWRGLTVLDFDNQAAYATWRLWISDPSNPFNRLPDTALQVTTSRGVHVYIRLPHTERNRHVGNIDIKGQAGYVLGPGSIHPSGKQYSTLFENWDIPLVGVLSDVLPVALLTTEQPTVKVWAPAPRSQPAGRGLVNKIKAGYKIEDFFPARQSSGGGRWFMTCCPFHEDHNPSFWIDAKNQICGCFAGCTLKPLDVINVYARLHGLDNNLAILEMGKQL